MAKRMISVDMTGVETSVRAAEGEHVAKIATIETATSQGGNDMLKAKFEVTKGESKGAIVYENYPLIDTALWKLKALLQAIGLKADGKLKLDLDKLEGKALKIVVIHEEYDGKVRAKIDEVRKLVSDVDADSDEEDDEDEDEEDDEPVKKTSKKATKKVVEEDEEEDEEEEDEEPAPKKSSKKAPAKSKKAAKVVDEDEDEDEYDDFEDEDEEEAPKKSSKKATAKKAAKKVVEEDDEEDDEEDWD